MQFNKIVCPVNIKLDSLDRISLRIRDWLLTLQTYHVLYMEKDEGGGYLKLKLKGFCA